MDKIAVRVTGVSARAMLELEIGMQLELKQGRSTWCECLSLANLHCGRVPAISAVAIRSPAASSVLACIITCTAVLHR